MKTENMRASTNVEDRRDEPVQYKRKRLLAAARAGTTIPQLEQSPQPANPQLMRPRSRQSLGYNEDLSTEQVKPIPELGLPDPDERRFAKGYEKGGPVTDAKKIRNKGYRPF